MQTSHPCGYTKMYLYMQSMLRKLNCNSWRAVHAVPAIYVSCSPLVAAHFKHSASQLPFADFREVLNLPGEFPIQPMRLGFCQRSMHSLSQAKVHKRMLQQSETTLRLTYPLRLPGKTRMSQHCQSLTACSSTQVLPQYLELLSRCRLLQEAPSPSACRDLQH